MCPPHCILAYYVDNIDPFIFKIGSWGPRWYGVAYLLGFLGAYLLIRKNSRDGMLRLAPKLVSDLVLNCCIFGVLIGGRLGFCLFYEPRLLGFTSEFPYWGVLKVWQGGMASHGGILFTILTIMVFSWQHLGKPKTRQIVTLIGGTFVCGGVGWAIARLAWDSQFSEIALATVCGMSWMVLYGWRQAIPITNIGDACCMVVPVGLFFGRCANFINGELYGRPTTLPWGVIFPSEVYAPTNGTIDTRAWNWDKLPFDLTGLQDSIALLNDKNAMTEPLASLARHLAAHNPVAVQQISAVLPPRHPSQLYEALLEGLLLFITCWVIGRKWRKDGMASGAFLTFYPIMRIIGEQFRVGDTPQTFFGLQLSMGVLLSLPMIVVGAIYWSYFMVRSKPNIWQPAPAEAPTPPNPPPKSA